MLILDEPTAALDGATEQRIAEGLRAALPGSTIIVITHKPALARQADMVVIIEHGAIRIESLHAVA